MTITDILNGSKVISDMVNDKQVKIVGAYYDITSGKVTFMDY